MTIEPMDARVWTRDDLPSMDELWERAKTENPWLPVLPPRLVLDAVVDHLNANGGVPAERHDLRDPWANLGAADKYRAVKRAERAESELARRNEELSEAEGEIAALTERAEKAEDQIAELNKAVTLNENTVKAFTKFIMSWRDRAKKAEAERDDWKAGAEAESWAHDKTLEEARRFHVERDEARDERDRARQALVVKENDHQELQAKLDAAKRLNSERQDTIERLIAEHYEFVDAAEDRPTLDRDAVADVLSSAANGTIPWSWQEAIAADIMALVPAAEGWPEWLGPKVDPDDFEVTRDSLGNIRVDGEVWASADATPDSLRDVSPLCVVKGRARAEAMARFVESEQAATVDEDQRVEEQAKALYEATGVDPEFNTWDQMIEPHKNHFRAAIRAGWTPPESEDE